MGVITKGIIVFAVLSMMFVPSLAQSETTLWDLLIISSLEKGSIFVGETPKVTGQIIDHSSKPVSGADVSIKSGVLSFFTTTDENGNFAQELTGFDGLPGYYVINIAAEKEEQIGLTSLELQVSGDVKESEILFKQIETTIAQKYIQSTEEDFADDPIGIQMYYYYQQIYNDYLEAVKFEQEEKEAEKILNGQRELARQLLQESIEEINPGAGVYEGWNYEIFVDNLDLSVKDEIVAQLNHTTTTFYEAQELMSSILENGGTYEEAREAYLSKLSITQEMMSNLTDDDEEIVEYTNNSTSTEEIPVVEESIKEVQESETIEQEQISGTNSTNIEVETSGNSIFINIDGIIIEFIVNGTQIIQVTNSTR